MERKDRSVARAAWMAGVVAVALTACASTSGPAKTPANYGEFDGMRVGGADPTLESLRVIAVDGYRHMDTPMTLRLAPGPRYLQVASARPGRRGEITYQPMLLVVEPCTKYRFLARHTQQLSNRQWEIVADGTHVRGGCDRGETSGEALLKEAADTAE